MQTKKPTRKQKQLLTRLRLNADNWLVKKAFHGIEPFKLLLFAMQTRLSKETAEGLCIVHRYSGRMMVIPRGLME